MIEQQANVSLSPLEAKRLEREALKTQLDQFLAGGNNVQHIAFGVTNFKAEPSDFTDAIKRGLSCTQA